MVLQESSTLIGAIARESARAGSMIGAPGPWSSLPLSLNWARMRGLLGFVLTAMTAACGGSVASADHVDGSVEGRAFHAVDATSALGTFTGADGGARQEAVIVVTDQGGACEFVSSPTKKPSVTYLVLTIAAEVDAVSPGTYAIDEPDVSMDVVAQDQNCVKTLMSDAATGTITLSSVGASGASGSFDVTLDGGEHLTGSFEAAGCAASIGDFFGVELSPVGKCGSP